MTVDEAIRALRREYARQYYAKNREHVRFLAKLSRIRCHEKIAAYRAAYRAKNKEKIRAYNREWLRKNRERKAAYKRANRAQRSQMARGREVLERASASGALIGSLMGGSGCNGAVNV